MIAGQTFANFQEMYQRAVKIARVLEESRLEKQTLEAGKRKIGPLEGDFLAIRGSNMATIREKGNNLQKGETLVVKNASSNLFAPLISAAQASKMLSKGCSVFLCAVEVLETPELEPRVIPVVQEFLEVFQEVPGLPPDREIEFAIELVPCLLYTSPSPRD